MGLLPLLDHGDSDGIIVSESGFGIQADERYNFTGTRGPDGLPIEIAPVLRNNDRQPVPGDILR